MCRLRDIQDLFAGTGVNPKAYALMDQDRLNHVLTAKPWERRIFIEEAAGVARYKQQRGETQGKLDATRQNLQLFDRAMKMFSPFAFAPGARPDEPAQADGAAEAAD